MAHKVQKLGRGVGRVVLAIEDPRERFEQILTDTEALLGLTITIHDLAGIFTTESGQSLLASERRSHRHSYCMALRKKRQGWDRKCVVHCSHFVNGELRKQQRPFVHACWKGVNEAAVPIVREQVHLATIFGGVFRMEKDARRKDDQTFPEPVQLLLGELAILAVERVDALCRVLETVGQGLLGLVEQDRRIGSGEGDREAEIRRFIHYRAHQRLALGHLAQALHLSESRTSHLVSELFGQPFKELLIEERIRRARSLLVGSTLTLGVIAERIGLQNEYYFSRLFKNRTGEPPGKFRNRHHPGIRWTREG